MTPKSRALVIWLSVMAGLQALVGASGLAEIFSDRVVTLLVVMTAALNAGTATFVAGARPLEVTTSPQHVVDKGAEEHVT